MAIKKHKNRNEYILTTEGLWVRNFDKNLDPIDINNFTRPEDYQLLVENELKSKIFSMGNINSESFLWREVVVVSDGYDFEKKHLALESLPKKVKILGTNNSLTKWKIKRPMDFYVVNNPYRECLNYLPKHDYYPPCIVSSRTNNDFIRRYKMRRATVYKYDPVREENFSTSKNGSIDDYRNPICAAISLAHKFGVEKLLLFTCDEVFADERPGADELENGLWMYPQHKISYSLIEGNLYWLSNSELPVEIGNYSDGPKIEYAENISEPVNFFVD
jgi:hypothetical protein